MENQHKQIKGYRDLTPAEIAIMNEIKEQAEKVRVLIESLNYQPDVDKRWLAIGQTNLQQGFMALTRAIARPTTF